MHVLVVFCLVLLRTEVVLLRAVKSGSTLSIVVGRLAALIIAERLAVRRSRD
jgi:hypothetical protein